MVKGVQKNRNHHRDTIPNCKTRVTFFTRCGCDFNFQNRGTNVSNFGSSNRFDHLEDFSMPRQYVQKKILS